MKSSVKLKALLIPFESIKASSYSHLLGVEQKRALGGTVPADRLLGHRFWKSLFLAMQETNTSFSLETEQTKTLPQLGLSFAYP